MARGFKFNTDFSNIVKQKSIYRWGKSIGAVIPFTSDYINGELKIEKYDIDKRTNVRYITLSYNGDYLKPISTSLLLKSRLGSILKDYCAYCDYKIGDKITGKNKDFVIIDRKFEDGKQYYKIHCNKCGFDSGKYISVVGEKNGIEYDEYWITKYDLERMQDCPCCGNKVSVIVPGINDLATTNPELVKYFVNGIIDASKVHKTSTMRMPLFCPRCNSLIENIKVLDFVKRKNKCHYCGGGGYYPNRFMFQLLQQLDIKFETEYSPKWIYPKRYDFYIPSLKLIIEMDGGLGHGNHMHTKSLLTLEESIEIDKLKDKVASNHNLKVIRINSIISDVDYIKENILNSDLSIMLNFNDNMFKVADRLALDSTAEQACNLYNSGMETIEDIANEIGAKPSSVRGYLHDGTKLGLCNYDNMKLRKQNAHVNLGSFQPKKVVLLNTREVFNSTADAQKQYPNAKNISLCCNGTRKYSGTDQNTYMPLVWIYYEDYIFMQESEIKNKIYNISTTKGRPLSIICLNTCEIFKSSQKAAEKFNLKTKAFIKACCDGKKDSYGKFNGKPLMWMYYKDYELKQNAEQTA